MAHVCILRQIALNFSQGDQDLNIYAYSVLPFLSFVTSEA